MFILIFNEQLRYYSLQYGISTILLWMKGSKCVWMSLQDDSSYLKYHSYVRTLLTELQYIATLEKICDRSFCTVWNICAITLRMLGMWTFSFRYYIIQKLWPHEETMRSIFYLWLLDLSSQRMLFVIFILETMLP